MPSGERNTINYLMAKNMYFQKFQLTYYKKILANEMNSSQYIDSFMELTVQTFLF